MQEIDFGIISGIGHKVFYFDVINSTNTWLKEHSSHYPDGTVVWAEQQLEGRGRMSRRWESPSGMGLYFSVLLKPELPNDQLSLFSLAASISLKHAVERYVESYNLPAKTIDIKWPNDLFISGKKIAGMLIEAITIEDKICLIIGIGLNITPGEGLLSDEVINISSSLTYFFGGNWERRQLLKMIFQELNEMYIGFSPEEIVKLYRKECSIWGHHCRVYLDGESFSGECLDINDKGELLVKTSKGIRKVISGSLEVKW